MITDIVATGGYMQLIREMRRAAAAISTETDGFVSSHVSLTKQNKTKIAQLIAWPHDNPQNTHNLITAYYICEQEIRFDGLLLEGATPQDRTTTLLSSATVICGLIESAPSRSLLQRLFFNSKTSELMQDHNSFKHISVGRISDNKFTVTVGDASFNVSGETIDRLKENPLLALPGKYFGPQNICIELNVISAVRLRMDLNTVNHLNKDAQMSKRNKPLIADYIRDIVSDPDTGISFSREFFEDVFDAGDDWVEVANASHSRIASFVKHIKANKGSIITSEYSPAYNRWNKRQP